MSHLLFLMRHSLEGTTSRSADRENAGTHKKGGLVMNDKKFDRIPAAQDRFHEAIARVAWLPRLLFRCFVLETVLHPSSSIFLMVSFAGDSLSCAL